jgi:hypothetical protein
VKREGFASLDAALTEARARVDATLCKERPRTVKALRDFGPEQQVMARIEISGPGLFRKPEGGIDVMGDGRVVAYAGTIRKERLAGANPEDAVENLRGALAR